MGQMNTYIIDIYEHAYTCKRTQNLFIKCTYRFCTPRLNVNDKHYEPFLKKFHQALIIVFLKEKSFSYSVISFKSAPSRTQTSFIKYLVCDRRDFLAKHTGRGLCLARLSPLQGRLFGFSSRLTPPQGSPASPTVYD